MDMAVLQKNKLVYKNRQLVRFGTLAIVFYRLSCSTQSAHPYINIPNETPQHYVLTLNPKPVRRTRIAGFSLIPYLLKKSREAHLSHHWLL